MGFNGVTISSINGYCLLDLMAVTWSRGRRENAFYGEKNTHNGVRYLCNSQNLCTFARFFDETSIGQYVAREKVGKMAEWSIAAVLKTVDLRGSGGSNPSLSANNFLVNWSVCKTHFFVL